MIRHKLEKISPDIMVCLKMSMLCGYDKQLSQLNLCQSCMNQNFPSMEYPYYRCPISNNTISYRYLIKIHGVTWFFLLQGDVDRCREMLDLAQQLVRNRKLNSVQDTNHARIVVNYLFSLMNCPDKSRGVQVCVM